MMEQMSLFVLLLISSLSIATTLASIHDTKKAFYTRSDLPSDKKWVALDDTNGNEGASFMSAPDPELVQLMKQRHYQQKQKQKQRRHRRAEDADEEAAQQADYDGYQAYQQEQAQEYNDNDADEQEQSYTAYDADSSSNTHYRDYFVDGSETFWPEGAQAWRLVGYYIDCYNVETGYRDRRTRHLFSDKHRQLPEDDEDVDSNACLRYLLWACYIDVNYEGGGIGEYQYYNVQNKYWDSSACNEMADTTGNSDARCVKMDCHLQYSQNFKLLGFFKEPNFAQFYEQLFKHQGVCLWDEDQYEFMQNMRGLWPQACTPSGMTDERGNLLYFDLRPIDEADVSLGLYTDERCSVDYQGKKTDIMDVIEYYEANGGANDNNNEGGSGDRNKNNDGSMVDLVTYMDDWNSAMEIYKTCQPCKAYNLNYEYSGASYTDDAQKGDDYYKNTYGKYWYYYKKNGEPDDDQSYHNGNFYYYYNDDRADNEDEDDYSNDDSNGHFLCADDAGYVNVNQCMKFATHTKMMAATFRDVMIGASQGTIKDVYVGNIAVHPGEYVVPGTNWRPADFLAMACSTLFFLGSAYMLHKSWQRAHAHDAAFAEPFKAPLVDDDDDQQDGGSRSSTSTPGIMA